MTATLFLLVLCAALLSFTTACLCVCLACARLLAQMRAVVQLALQCARTVLREARVDGATIVTRAEPEHAPREGEISPAPAGAAAGCTDSGAEAGRQAEFVVAVPQVPRVTIAAGVLTVIHDDFNAFFRTHGTANETGGLLVGTLVPAEGDDPGAIVINGFIPAGPKAEFSPGSILFDEAYQEEQFRALQLEHPSLVTTGCVHRHPGAFDECSDEDAVTDRTAVRSTPTQTLVFAIVTVDNPNEDGLGLRCGNLKFDFFVMSATTGFSYVKVKPAVADLKVVTPSAVMVFLLRCRGALANLDLGALRRVPGLGQMSLQVVEDSGAKLLIEVWDSVCQHSFHLLAAPDGALRLLALDRDGAMRELRGPWEQPENGRHIWLTHLLALARYELKTGTDEAVRMGPHRAWWRDNRQRLVAEITAMEQKHPGRARLERDGDALFWVTEVRECGRRLPIRINYPDNYPASPPRIVSLADLPATPHQLGGNELCWTNLYTNNADWNPGRDTAVICIAAAHRWFACFLVFRTLGEWPHAASH